MSALPTPARSGAAVAAAGSAAKSAATSRTPADPIAALEDLNVRVVTDDETICLRQGRALAYAHIAPDQAGLDAVVQVADPRAGQHDRMLELGPLDVHVVADRRVRADVGVADLRPAADDRGAAHGRALEPRPRLDHHAALDPRVDQLALDPLLQVVEDQPVGLEHVLDLAGVLPPSVHDVRVHAQPAVDERLDGVGDLELAAT